MANSELLIPVRPSFFLSLPNQEKGITILPVTCSSQWSLLHVSSTMERIFVYFHCWCIPNNHNSDWHIVGTQSLFVEWIISLFFLMPPPSNPSANLINKISKPYSSSQGHHSNHLTWTSEIAFLFVLLLPLLLLTNLFFLQHQIMSLCCLKSFRGLESFPMGLKRNINSILWPTKPCMAIV